MKNKTLLFFGFMYAMMLLASLIQIVKLENKIAELEARPAVTYQVDNAGGMTDIGVVTAKTFGDGQYSVAVNGYGWFLVDKEHYDMIEVGRKAPEYLLERGS